MRSHWGSRAGRCSPSSPRAPPRLSPTRASSTRGSWSFSPPSTSMTGAAPGRGRRRKMTASRSNPDPAARAAIAAQVALVVAVVVVPELAFAQATMPGQQLLTFAKNFIIAPIALFAIVISGVAAFVRPDLIKTTGYIAIIAVILYFLLANADRLMQAIRAG